MLIYDALKKDHKEVKALLEKLLILDENSKGKSDLIKKIGDALVPHSRAEEAVFYNSLREMDAGKDMIMHSYKEHMEAEALLKILELRDKIDANWKKTAEKLKTALEHHIQEEEGRLFTIAKQVFTTEEAMQIGAAFEKMKPEVEKEGFVGTTADLIKNLMPPRFTKNPKIPRPSIGSNA